MLQLLKFLGLCAAVPGNGVEVGASRSKAGLPIAQMRLQLLFNSPLSAP
jgi:hypothetical protein